MGGTLNIKAVTTADDSGLKKLSKSAEGLKQSLSGVVKVTGELKPKILNFAALSTSIDSITSSIDSLNATFTDLSNAYAVQVEAETKLEEVMRQRMGATQEDITAIKELASAQQSLGVIGDEVQLMGAQQLATFLKQRSSLESLIPAMNNLVAQQKGYNASTGDAVNVANLMGKALQGQTGALSRIGISFNDAQAHVLKYGSEAEKAAMLAEIITQNVGNMNERLAQTPVGRAKQLSNAIGDIKEQAGQMVQSFMPFLNMAASFTTAAGGAIKLGAGIHEASVATLRWVTGARSMKGALSSLTVGTKALGVAMRTTFAATGIGLAIWGVTAAIEALIGKTGEAKAIVNDLVGTSDAFIDTSARVQAEMQREAEELKKTYRH